LSYWLISVQDLSWSGPSDRKFRQVVGVKTKNTLELSKLGK